MSTTSTVITIIICVLLVAAIGSALVKGIWSVSKKITVPIQIALFVVMLVCVVRLFCTKENAQKLYKGVEQTGISQNVESTMRTALNMKPVETSSSDAKPAQVATAPAADAAHNPAPKAETVQAAPGVKAAAQVAEAPASEAVVKPAPQPVAESEPAPAKVPDYSHLDKGKKSFTYALPFNAKVAVGFRDNTYRVIAESLGSLDSSEKKEIGGMILDSLGKYVGKTVNWSDKSKVSIESRYDEADDRTRVFAIVPPDAID